MLFLAKYQLFCTEPKGKAGAGKGAAANPDRAVDISRLDIRVGCIISVEKVPVKNSAIIHIYYCNIVMSFIYKHIFNTLQVVHYNLIAAVSQF